jgi:regulator of protease activity HflC (stomatin/prohibitin superfamily)
MVGAAELAKADQNRQILVTQAKAQHEASKLTALAEIERAKGAAQANEIMSKSLGGPENYLRWRYIHMLEQSDNTNREVIYIPVDGLLPLTEAGRALKK